MSALTSDRMRRLLAEAAASFDWVIIDTPPVGILTDANLLGSIVDAAVLVVRAGKTSAAEVQRAVQALGREKILGVVLNRAERRHSSEADSYYYASYYFVQSDEPPTATVPMAKGLIPDVTWRSTTLVLFENVLIVSAIGAGAYLRLGGRRLGAHSARTTGCSKALFISFVCQLCLYYGDLYDNPRLTVDHRELLVRIFQAFGATSLILSALYYWFPDLILGRGVFAISAALAGAGDHRLAARIRLDAGARRAPGAAADGRHERRGHQPRPRAARAPRAWRRGRRASSTPTRPGSARRSSTRASSGPSKTFPAIVRARSIDKVVVSMADARGKLPMDKLLEMRLEGVAFEHLASVYETYTGKIALENLRPSWLIFSAGFHRSRWKEAVKRAIDVCAALIGGRARRRRCWRCWPSPSS